MALDRLFPPDLSRLRATGTEVLDREGRVLSVLPAPGGVWRLRTGVEDVPPHLVAMLVAAEDRRFYAHPGVDPLALARAAAQWVRAGRVVSGGSTLTMQAVRLLEPRPRNLRAKAIEALRALQLEARFDKREILGIWLTLASQGGNVEGVRAGALAWFGRPAARLDPGESALLVAIPRHPNRLRPDRHPEAARAARDDTLRRRAFLAGDVTEWDNEAAFASAVPSVRQPMPRLAPHLARQVAGGAAGRAVTTLDAPLQRAAEAVAAGALRELPERVTVALIVAELRSREVRALVGGSWGDESRAGSLDLSRAVRSPGSALKPLLYGLAFEAGIVAPNTVVSDLPLRFGTYAPENFDHGFVGRVTAAEALRLSLNLPAVALLDRLGPIRFAEALKRAGAPPRLPAGADPSLPLALGGAGTTLRELAGVYAALGDGGRGLPLRAVAGDGDAARGSVAGTARGDDTGTARGDDTGTARGDAAGTARAVLEPGAAAMLAGVLVQRFPGGGPAGIAWKTGTSWGGRDAWALGFDGRHVAGVWIGRPDGTPIPGATGRDLALPLLARLFALLPAAPLEAAAPRVASAVPGAEAPDRLRLLFPPPGAVLAEGGTVTLRASGGRRPLNFLVDGIALPAERAKREAGWLPSGPGRYRVTVLDADGVSAHAEVRVRPRDAPAASDGLPTARLVTTPSGRP
nr:penicillin-binding protein 1C [Roseomonas acroporae]